MTLTFDYVEPDQLQDAINIEQDGYPADEAASLSAFRLRQSQAPDLFLGAYIDGKLVGYVCSTLSNDETLTEESMKRHVPGGKSVCVHSVCVDRGMWGKGVGGRLLGEYVKRVGEAGVNKYERILLITHDELRGFYEKAGFEWVGESSVVHGARKWYEMRILLDRAPQISQDVLKELLKPTQKEELRTPHLVSSSSSQVPSSAQQSTSQERTSQEKAPNFLSEFKDAFEDLVVQHPTDQGVLVNKYDLMCPRGCRSVILKRGVGMWVERSSVQMEPPNTPPHPLLPPLPSPPTTTNWWLVTGSPMVFENVGFSRGVFVSGSNPGSESGTSTPAKRLKLLTCAECDLGPVGWCEEGGREFWVAVGRVGYRRE